MSTAIWDPDTILQITDPAGRGMFCCGLVRPRFDSRCRSRCRWDVPPARYFAILALLGSISTNLPHDVTNTELRRIARLGLCEYHGNQEDEVVANWENVLDRVEVIYRTYEDQREEIIRNLRVLQREMNDCRSLLEVKEDCDEALSLVLRRHLNIDALLNKAACARLDKDQAEAKDEKEENCRLSAENSRLSTLLIRAEEEQQRCKNKESNLAAECETLRKQNAELRGMINSGKDKYNDLQDREQSAALELMAATTRLHEVQSVNQGSENYRKTLQSEIDMLKEEMKGLHDNNTSISSQLASTAASLEAVTKERSAANNVMSTQLQLERSWSYAIRSTTYRPQPGTD